MNISDVRKNLSNLMKSVSDTQNPIIIIQDSRPVAEIIPYNEDRNKKLDEWKKELHTLLEKIPE